MDKLVWNTSSRCESSMCTAVAFTDDRVLIANTANLADHLTFTPDEWRTFIEGAKAGEFDVA